MKIILKKCSGSAIIEYTIIAALVVMVVISGLGFLGQSVNKNYNDTTLALKNNVPNSLSKVSTTNKNLNKTVIDRMIIDEAVKNGTLKAGQLGGTPSSPAADCVNGVCSVDFGEYALNNLPENFKEFVDTTGYSGGTIILANRIQELAEQTADIPEFKNIDFLFQLAQTGHALATTEQGLEASALESLEDPSKVKNTFVAQATKLTGGQDRAKFDNLLTLINQQFPSPLSSEDQSLINLINYLGGQITSLADQLGTTGKGLTGNNLTSEDINAILYPNASVTTHIDSSIICSTTNGTDSGIDCSK